MARRSIFPEQKDEYLGNMWGWKFSLFGLGLILLMLALMSYKYCQIKAETGQEKVENITTKQ
ncbi:MAG: hypothetical protein HKN76_00475 [Saprospiraceae bacterium]|nr:hypothetical protein [Saprospiraceae bacterium]